MAVTTAGAFFLAACVYGSPSYERDDAKRPDANDDGQSAPETSSDAAETDSPEAD